MDWMNKLPLKQKIVTGCYLVAALFAVPVLITLILMDRLLIGIILVAVLAALTYPLARFIERTLTSSFEDISNVTHTIAKGDFTSRADENGSMGDISRSFNTMIDKLKKSSPMLHRLPVRLWTPAAGLKTRIRT